MRVKFLSAWCRFRMNAAGDVAEVSNEAGAEGISRGLLEETSDPVSAEAVDCAPKPKLKKQVVSEPVKANAPAAAKAEKKNEGRASGGRGKKKKGGAV